jgi:hypothetical protein
MGPQLEEQEPTFAFHYWWNANISTQNSRPGWLGPAHSHTYSSHKEAHCNVPTTGAQIPGDGRQLNRAVPDSPPAATGPAGGPRRDASQYGSFGR